MTSTLALRRGRTGTRGCQRCWRLPDVAALPLGIHKAASRESDGARTCQGRVDPEPIGAALPTVLSRVQGLRGYHIAAREILVRFVPSEILMVHVPVRLEVRAVFLDACGGAFKESGDIAQRLRISGDGHLAEQKRIVLVVLGLDQRPSVQVHRPEVFIRGRRAVSLELDLGAAASACDEQCATRRCLLGSERHRT